MTVYKSLKGVIERVLATILLVVLIVIPLLPITMLAIFIEDPGNVFFTQKRIGQNGKMFKIIKFRSMYKDADKKIKASIADGTTDKLNFKKDGSRMVTRVGNVIRNLSIDELPQLLNIIKGDMSVIGPRPLQAFEVEAYCQENSDNKKLMKTRLSVKPGLLCFWQVTPHKEELSFQERMQLDYDYVKKESLKTDINIFYKGIKTILSQNNM